MIDDQFNRFRPRLLELLSKRLGKAVGRIDPDALLTEVFLSARRKWGGQDAAEVPYSWLVRLTLDKLVEAWRQIDRRGEVPWPEQSSEVVGQHLFRSDPGPSSEAARHEQAERVRAVLAMLSADDRDILMLRYYLPLSVEEVAVILDVSVNVAAVRQTRALKRLRQKWTELFGQGDGP